MTKLALPPYVYQEVSSHSSLLQGDILRVEGEFRSYFDKFYPGIVYKEPEKDRYVMVLTQSCD